MNIIIKTKFEELLIKNWASFIDTNRLMSLVLTFARDNQFPIIKTEDLKIKGTQIKLSRFEPDKTGFILWAEFCVPREEGMVVGTAELLLSNLGDVTPINILGNLFQKKDN